MPGTLEASVEHVSELFHPRNEGTGVVIPIPFGHCLKAASTTGGVNSSVLQGCHTADKEDAGGSKKCRHWQLTQFTVNKSGDGDGTSTMSSFVGALFIPYSSEDIE